MGLCDRDGWLYNPVVWSDPLPNMIADTLGLDDPDRVEKVNDCHRLRLGAAQPNGKPQDCAAAIVFSFTLVGLLSETLLPISASLGSSCTFFLGEETSWDDFGNCFGWFEPKEHCQDGENAFLSSRCAHMTQCNIFLNKTDCLENAGCCCWGTSQACGDVGGAPS